jgi:hypothetical protein
MQLIMLAFQLQLQRVAEHALSLVAAVQNQSDPESGSAAGAPGLREEEGGLPHAASELADVPP